MGIDLTLLVVEVDLGSWGYAHTMLEIGRDYDFADALSKQHPKPRPGFKLSSFRSQVPDGSFEGESCYGLVEETPYGEPLTYLTVAEILEAWTEYGPDRTSCQLRAVIAYLRELDSHSIVALFWH